MADIVPGWMWRDPGEIIEQLLQRSSRSAARSQGLVIGHAAPMPAPHDRYYTMARRARVRAALRGAKR